MPNLKLPNLTCQNPKFPNRQEKIAESESLCMLLSGFDVLQTQLQIGSTVVGVFF